MIRYLEPQEVADRLGVTRRTAMSLMMEMNPIPVCGKVRMRYRVTEQSLDQWMAKRMIGRPKTGTNGMGSKRKLERR
jgi:hypothetical protein